MKKTLGRNMCDAVEDLLANFDSEFVVGRFGMEGEGMEPRKTPMVTDDEEVSSFNSLCDQVRGCFVYAFLVVQSSLQRFAVICFRCFA